MNNYYYIDLRLTERLRSDKHPYGINNIRVLKQPGNSVKLLSIGFIFIVKLAFAVMILMENLAIISLKKKRKKWKKKKTNCPNTNLEPM